MEEKSYCLPLVFGATAVGKTRFLETLLSCWKNLSSSTVEVIVADSRQVYQDMPIVTAQAPDQLRKNITHHLVETLHFRDPYTVGDFCDQAAKLVKEIQQRGNHALIVGGSAYYLHHFWKGAPTTPKVPPDLRKKILEEYQERGLDAMYEDLRQRDADYAEKISAHDKQRILRAQEIIRYSGKKIHSFTPKKEKSPYKVLPIGLKRERATLYHRINARVDEMMQKGLVSEVQSLWKQGLNDQMNAFHTIGIQELLQDSAVQETWKRGEKLGSLKLAELTSLIKRNTRRYAKRQESFFTRFQDITWYDLGREEEEQRLVRWVCDSLLSAQ